VVTRRLTTIGTLLALGIAAHTALNLRRLRRPSPSVPPVDEPVSVLIPARDEEQVIATAVTSALQQAGVDDLEVLVLDDGSTDATAAVVAGIDDPRLRLIRSEVEPPAGWLGKPWACMRLAEQAHGTVLVFMDADVNLGPDAVRASVRALRAHDFALVSPYPRQLAGNWLAALTQPLIPWSWSALLPLRLAEQSLRPSLAAATGQLIVVDARAYAQVGGHASVAHEVLEDVALMRAFRRAGLRTCTMDGSRIASSEMYPSPAAVVDGYAKSMWTAFGGPLGSVCVNALLLTVYVIPPLAALTSRSRGTRTIGRVGYLAAVASRAMVARRTGTRVWPDSAMQPASIAAFVAINAISWRRHLQGANRWKGRAVR